MEAFQAFLYQLAVSFDLPVLDWIQAHLQSGFMDTIMPIITLFGEGGIFWIAWAVILLIIPKTRKIGLSMIIALLLGQREDSKFHVNQALVIWIASLLGVIPCVGWIWGIFCVICAIMGFVAAINGEEKEVPLLGKIKLLK